MPPCIIPDYPAILAKLIQAGHTTRSIGMCIGLSQPSVSRLATGRTARMNANAAFRLIEMAGGRIELPGAQTEAYDAT